MSIDKAYNQLPEFVGKYGGMSGGGKRRNARKSRRAKKQRGGLSPANVTMPSMLLAPAEEKAAFVAPQYYTENVEVPNFSGPANAYVQKAGTRRRRRNAKKQNRK